MKPKILHLIVSKRPFEVMVTGEKSIEYRKPSKWIESRLIGKDYDLIKITHGYGKNRPYFIAVYCFFSRALADYTPSYSNELTVNVEPNDYKIYIGTIIEKGNLP